MDAGVRGLADAGRHDVGTVGGKAANLGELVRLGIRVPDGFVVTTGAAPPRAELPPEVVEAVRRRVEPGVAYAVRSSATAEDLPDASSAGQLDSFLDVVGPEAVLDAVRRCRASLFGERANAYRGAGGVGSDDVRTAVIVQRMVRARVAGVLFTADPVTGHRGVTAVEAVRGLADALISGRADPDRYTVRDGVVRSRHGDALSDAELLALAALGRRIEAGFGGPQDVEWCLDDDGFAVVQSRPITTLFPVPEAAEGGDRVYLSVGHAQMMTDAMKPLGLSLFRRTAGRPMFEAGGRLFVDVTRELSSPGREGFLGFVGRGDPLAEDALRSAMPDAPPPATGSATAPPPRPEPPDPGVVRELVDDDRAAIASLEREIRGRTGVDLVDFVIADVERLTRRLADPRSMGAIFAGMDAATWLDATVAARLGEPAVSSTLSQSVEGNVTSEMGLALLDVADALRPHPGAIAYLEHAPDDGFLDGLTAYPEAHAAMAAFLERYGMRCPGEIDVTRPRWREAPSALVPALLANVRNASPGAAARRFTDGLRDAEATERSVVDRLERLPGGAEDAAEARRQIGRLRALAGYREYPKYSIVSRYFIYKQALAAEGRRLVAEGVLADPHDLDFLSLDELREVARARVVDRALVERRRARHARDRRLVAPRVLTSHGERIEGALRVAAPPRALVGIPVSAGVVEGRARVLADLADASRLEVGDILVTRFTDPSWTPVFLTVAGLVTEVGGRMTHGAVIAREYGLVAVVGVTGATARLRDGQRIRVHGGAGYVEPLD